MNQTLWFKNAYVFNLTEQFQLTAEQLHQALINSAFLPCGKMDQESYGWAPPIKEEKESLVFTKNGYHLLSLKKEEKVIPANCVNERMDKRIIEFEEKENRRISKREKAEIKEGIINDLLPTALTQTSFLSGYIDTNRSRLVINTNNEKKAEEFVVFLRASIDNLPTDTPSFNNTQEITNWLLGINKLPDKLNLATFCILKGGEQKGTVINCKNQNLRTTEIKEHLTAGKMINQLSLFWTDKLLITIVAEKMVIRNIQPLGAIKSELREYKNDPTIIFQIMTLELSELIDYLTTWFDFPF